MTTYAHVFETPPDRVFVAVDETGALLRVNFLDGRSPEELADGIGDDVEWCPRRCRDARGEIEAYFAGERSRLDLPTAASGTDFQRAVWSEVRKIPFGETASYGEVAKRLGRPGASRAVGRANATNPICLVVPCHRVIGADGSLTGFGGGIETKRALLELEAGVRQAELPGLARRA